MRLATAFVEIAARTDEFRRQLDEARQLASTSADAIRQAFASPPSFMPDTGPSRRPDADHQSDAQGSATRTASAPTGQQDITAAPPILPDGWISALSGVFGGLLSGIPPVIAPELSEPRTGGTAAGDRITGSSSDDTAALLKQQLDLERKELDVLNRQLEVLQEVRQGVPAVLT